MDLAIPDLTLLDPTVVAQVQAELVERLLEAYPQIDTRRGVVHDAVLQVVAALATAYEDKIDLLKQSWSLLAISRNPVLADPATVDAVLANFLITRQPGAAATGPVTVVVSQLVPTGLPAGAVYTALGVAFAPLQPYAARISAAAVVSASDVVLVPVGDGTYAFTIPMTALTTGSQGAIKRGTRLVPAVPPPNFVTAYAAGDFSGGVNPESNADLLARLQAGIATKAWSNRVSIDAMIRQRPAFARILQTSIIGAMDPEMIRDQHTIFPVSLFGRCDLYVRTALLPLVQAVPVVATLIQKVAAGGVWQFSLTAQDAPGFYMVQAVLPPTAPPGDTGYPVTSDVRGFDPTVADVDVVAALEGVYSPLQAATFQFTDTQTPTLGLTLGTSHASYTALVVGLPQLAAIQAFVNDRAQRCPAGDCLVKAAVPCFLSLGFTVRKRATAADPDVAALANALATAVNTLGFAGQLHASILAGVAYPFLPDGTALSAIDMLGRIRRPDGTWVGLHGTAVLVVPNEPQNMVTPRTVCFFLDPADVAITIEAVDSFDA